MIKISTLLVFFTISLQCFAGGLPVVYDANIGTPTSPEASALITLYGKQKCGDDKATKIKLAGTLALSAYDLPGVGGRIARNEPSSVLPAAFGSTSLVAGDYSADFAGVGVAVKSSNARTLTYFQGVDAGNAYIAGEVQYNYGHRRPRPEFAIPGVIPKKPTQPDSYSGLVGRVILTSRDGRCQFDGVFL